MVRVCTVGEKLAGDFGCEVKSIIEGTCIDHMQVQVRILFKKLAVSNVGIH